MGDKSKMATPESKVDEFREVGLAIAAPIIDAMLPGGKPIETLANVFSVAHGQAEQFVQNSLLQQVWAGIIDPSQLSIRVNGADASILAAQVEAAKAKQSTDTHRFLMMLDQLDQQIADLEAGFEERHGDAWREELALMVLDEDEMPQREEGESLEDYRERLEEAITDKMIDPETGKVRPEYTNDPRYEEYIEWAEREHARREIEPEAQEIAAMPESPEKTERLKKANDDLREVVEAKDYASDQTATQARDAVEVEIAQNNMDQAGWGMG